jgi:hypothetical protein
VTERHITQKQSVRKDEIPRAFSGKAPADVPEWKSGRNSTKTPLFSPGFFSRFTGRLSAGAH